MRMIKPYDFKSFFLPCLLGPDYIKRIYQILRSAAACLRHITGLNHDARNPAIFPSPSQKNSTAFSRIFGLCMRIKLFCYTIVKFQQYSPPPLLSVHDADWLKYDSPAPFGGSASFDFLRPTKKTGDF